MYNSCSIFSWWGSSETKLATFPELTLQINIIARPNIYPSASIRCCFKLRYSLKSIFTVLFLFVCPSVPFFFHSQSISMKRIFCRGCLRKNKRILICLCCWKKKKLQTGLLFARKRSWSPSLFCSLVLGDYLHILLLFFINIECEKSK